MKKLMIVAFATMLTGSTVTLNASDGDKKNTAKSEISANEKSGKIGISVDIAFGRGEGCPGRGLCYIRGGVSLRVHINYNQDGNGTLTIQVPETYIIENQPDKLQYFTGQSKFVVEEDYVVPSDICAGLGTHDQLVIRAGSYKMSFLDGIYTIIIGDML